MKTTLSKRLQWVLNGLQSRDFDFTTSSEYGEPGYSTDMPIILFANWNDLDKSELKAVKSVAEIEWSDEWTDDGQGRAFRTQPDSHGWTPAWFEHDGEVVPYDELPESGEDLAEALRDYGFTYEPGDTIITKALPPCISLERVQSFATLVVDDCETGFHPGQNDRPVDKLKGLPPGDYVFRIEGTGQFDVSWQVWKLNTGETES